MSDIQIPGVNSRYNTNKIVEQLMEVEKIPMNKLDNTILDIEADKKIWQQINTNVSSLQQTSASLFGYKNPFSERIVESTDSSIITATASRNAELSDYNMKVLQTAKVDKLLSANLKHGTNVEKGRYTFKIGEKKISFLFAGGKLEEFSKALNQKGNNLLRSSVVKITPEENVILLESQVPGAKNSIQFLDDSKSLVQKLGISSPQQSTNLEININNLADKNEFNIEKVETEKIINPQNSIKIPVNIDLANKDDYVLEINYRLKDISETRDNIPTPIGFNLDVPGNIQREDIVVNFDASKPGIPEWQKPAAPKKVEDFNIFSINNDYGTKELPKSSKSELNQNIKINVNDLNNQIKTINVNNKNSDFAVVINDINIYNPKSSNEFKPLNAIEEADDAIIEYNGIRITRDSNKIDDVIPDITLNLHRESNENVTLNTKPDKEQIKNQIIEFVVDYNTVLQNTIIATSNNEAVVDEITYLSDDEKEDLKENLGRMQGDMTLIQLKNRLKTIVSDYYPTSDGAELNMLYQAGVGSNLSGFSGYTASKNRGYLELDESKLESVIENNIVELQALFGYDTNGDLIADKGIGVQMSNFTKPFVQNGGIISSRIQSYDSKTQRTNDNIDSLERRLESKESEYKRKFGRMESMVDSLENNSKALDSLSNNNK